jgi:hypothetical protein
MYYTLDIPWGFQHPDVQYWKDKKVHVYKGALLPPELRRFASEDFSFARWREDELNGIVMPPEKGSVKFTPKPHQIEAAKAILKAYYTNKPGFLEADKTGLGKTLSTLAGIVAIAKKEGFSPKKTANLLIVCPKGVIPQWRQTIHNYPLTTAVTRPLIINYQQLNKLLKAPPTARVAKKARTKNRQTARNGKPTVDWDFIIFDEAHYLKNYPSSGVSMSAASVAKLNEKYERKHSPFVIFSTATPGASPLNLSLMSGFLAPLLQPNLKEPVTPDIWAPFLEKIGFAVKKGKSSYSWAPLPWKPSDGDPEKIRNYKTGVRIAKMKQRKDAQRIGRALLSPKAPFIMRSPKDIAGWPEQQTIPFPIQLTSKQQPIYEEAWTRFRDFLRLTPAKSDPRGALVETLRYRQKSSLLKVESMIDAVEDFVEGGNQVYISCEFIETIDQYKKALTKKGIKVCEISGRTTADREKIRIQFQKGMYDVVLCTVVAGISLHSGETLPDGTKATSIPRVTIIHDIRQNNLDTEQALGRAHRDGTNSISYFPYLEKTVDEKIIQSFTNKTANMKSMLGSSLDDAEFLDRMFREAAARTTPPNRHS